MTYKQLLALKTHIDELSKMYCAFENIVGIEYDDSVSPNITITMRHGLDNYFDNIDKDGNITFDKSKEVN